MTPPDAPLPGPVGILGGMGPEATILLQTKLLSRVEARDDADHIPLLIDMNPQVPSRIAHLIDGTGVSPAPVLIAMAKRLAAAGASALAMPCNTAHAFADDIRGAVDIPFLDMVALTCARLGRDLPEGTRVGILASPAVRKIGLFDAALARQGLTPHWPETDAAVLDSIRAIKRHGATEASSAGLLDAARALGAAGAGHLIIACTEFSLATNRLANTPPHTDAMDVLADEIAAHWNTAHREASLP